VKKIFIAGAGGHMKEQIEWLKDFIIEKNDYEIKGFLSKQKLVKNKYKLPTTLEKNLKIDKDIYIYLAIGDPFVREKIFNKFKNFNFLTMIHPSSFISSQAKIGKGCSISPQCILAGDAKIDKFNNLNSGTYISHDCNIGKNNTFSPCVKILGGCTIGKNNFFGSNSVLIPKIKLNNENIIGAGAVIINNFKSKNTIVGNPARIKR
jgi:acetyltransferase EpsM